MTRLDLTVEPTPTLLASRGMAASVTIGFTNSKGRHPPQISTWKKRLPTIVEEDVEEKVMFHAIEFVNFEDQSPALPTCIERVSDAVAVMQRLKDSGKAERSKLFASLLKVLPTLAMSEAGSKVVQAALEAAKGPERTALTNKFQGSVLKLCTSSHGCEVLVSLIQSMPVSSIGFIADEIAGRGAEIARHRYGFSVLEVMVMHCPDVQMAKLIAELTQDAVELSRHPHGSAVLNHLLEYANSEYTSGIVQRLVPQVPLLSMHRTASHVVKKAFNYCSGEAQHAIAMAVLQAKAPASVADIACSRCGSSILQEVANANAYTVEFHSHLVKALPRLGQSKFGRRVIVDFELMTPVSEASSRGSHTHSAAAAA